MAGKKGTGKPVPRSKKTDELWEKENLINLGVSKVAEEFFDPLGMQRDAFAMVALQGLCATRAQHKMDMIATFAPEICATAYLMADEMLKLKKYDNTQLKQYLALNASKPK
jgi:hypothetical protein